MGLSVVGIVAALLLHLSLDKRHYAVLYIRYSLALRGETSEPPVVNLGIGIVEQHKRCSHL